MRRGRLWGLWSGLVVLGFALAGCAAGSPPAARTADQTALVRAAPPEPRTDQEPAEDATVGAKDPTGCTWVETAATVAFGEQETKQQAYAQAVAEARAKALQRVLGVTLRQRVLDFAHTSSLRGDVTLIERLLQVTQPGRILREQRLSSGPQDLPDCRGCRYGVRLRVCVVPDPITHDADFRVTLALNRARFRAGEEARLTVTVSQDAYVYIYSVDLEWTATLLVPNAYARDNALKAAQPFVYPSEDLHRHGLTLVARLPAGAAVSAETIRVIAVKRPLPSSVLTVTADDATGATDPAREAGRDGRSFLRVMQALQQAQVDWVEDVQAFLVEQD